MCGEETRFFSFPSLGAAGPFSRLFSIEDVALRSSVLISLSKSNARWRSSPSFFFPHEEVGPLFRDEAISLFLIPTLLFFFLSAEEAAPLFFPPYFCHRRPSFFAQQARGRV